MTVFVIHKNDYNGMGVSVYIGRPSVLGNPYTHIKNKKTLAKFVVSTREESIKKYREYFYKHIEGSEYFRNELERIHKLSINHDIYLICWCKPLSCHGDIIKEYLDILSERQYKKEYMGDWSKYVESGRGRNNIH